MEDSDKTISFADIIRDAENRMVNPGESVAERAQPPQDAHIVSIIQSLRPILRKIEKNTSILPRFERISRKGDVIAHKDSLKERATLIPAGKKIVGQNAVRGTSQEHPALPAREATLAREVQTEAIQPVKKEEAIPEHLRAAKAAPEASQRPRKESIALPAREATGRFRKNQEVELVRRGNGGRFVKEGGSEEPQAESVGKQASSEAQKKRNDNKQAVTIGEKLKAGLKAVGAQVVGAAKDKVSEADTAEAAGKAAGGPFFEAAREMHGLAVDIKAKSEDETTLIGKMRKAYDQRKADKEAKAVSASRAPDATPGGPSQPIAQAVPTVKEVPVEVKIEQSELASKDRDKEHSKKPAEKKSKAPKEKKTSYKPKEKEKQKPIAIATRQSAQPAPVDNAGGGIIDLATSLMGKGGGLLGSVAKIAMPAVSSIAGPAISALSSMALPALAVGATAAGGALIGTGTSKAMDWGTQKITGDKDATAGGSLYNTLHSDKREMNPSLQAIATKVGYTGDDPDELDRILQERKTVAMAQPVQPATATARPIAPRQASPTPVQGIQTATSRPRQVEAPTPISAPKSAPVTASIPEVKELAQAMQSQAQGKLMNQRSEQVMSQVPSQLVKNDFDAFHLSMLSRGLN